MTEFVEGFSFQCPACGTCCSSAPRLSLPELFRHQQRLLGQLAISRVVLPPGANETLLHPLPRQGEFAALVARAFDDRATERCPALDADGRCTVEVARTVNGELERALALRRADLATDKRFWGDIVFSLLSAELLEKRDSAARIPTDGFLTLSLAPALAVIAGVSERCRLRVLEYLDAQLPLGRALLGGLVRRPDRAAAAHEVEGLLRANAGLHRALGNTRRFAARVHGALDASAIEAWLDISSPGRLRPLARKREYPPSAASLVRSKA
ncbi:MAG TPA: hypothetical protein VMS65_09525 [Polyangiaceae bacterium]|nr:hypothetical protein [Polyangiaceae bacterium]